MTRTRTQTTLTKLVTLLANVNGELEFVRSLLDAEPAHRGALGAREATLAQKREAVIAAIHQFDPRIDTGSVGATEGWWVGRRPRSSQSRVRRYLGGLTQW